jgi:hypothetical protein
MQAPSVHFVWSVGQLAAQALFAHTWPLEHFVEHVPQCMASEPTQLPSQASRPALQRHWPPWQV